MASNFSLRALLPLALSLAALANGLALDTFGGQAEASILEDKVVDKSHHEAARLLKVAEADEKDDYTCSKTRGCKIGCCGSL